MCPAIESDRPDGPYSICFISVKSIMGNSPIKIMIISRQEYNRFRAAQDAQNAMENEEGICPICLEPLRHNILTHCITPCKHHFHYECLRPWVRNKHVCPVCRKLVNMCYRRIFSSSWEPTRVADGDTYGGHAILLSAYVKEGYLSSVPIASRWPYETTTKQHRRKKEEGEKISI